ncbi:hypothetical protein EZV62_014744 [Acer yangbiense]|uniref:CCHC-type domain-containing protein n=1 Tax=Acer yangbiense TaxID=1000413 RepID=A0A5C7HT01_9ROSI|nr:hypothetical protein EZV62_014744 [Acer yangbiense]
MDSDIAKLYENLSLADEDVGIHEMSEEVQRDGVADVNHCLVGKVLSGKKVNIEAFKGLIEQLWNQFGVVEIESLGDNIFMFHFNNPEDRNRIWQRGLWYFDKSLIALEKPRSLGEISLLGFNKVELWVQIHDVPIMCMNRRTAKWLAEQLGGVIEIPTESKECWGKFMRVKVLIEISKPLKRWLRLKLDKSDNIVLVGLKYERLPEFCYACGKIGHVIKDCLDAEARSLALTGTTTKFGSWMRAQFVDRRKVRVVSKSEGSFSDKDRSAKGIRELINEDLHNLEAGLLSSQQNDSANLEAVSRLGKVGASVENLIPFVGPGSILGNDVWVEGPTESSVGEKVQLVSNSLVPISNCLVGGADTDGGVIFNTPMVHSELAEIIVSPKMKCSKKWKRSARAGLIHPGVEGKGLGTPMGKRKVVLNPLEESKNLKKVKAVPSSRMHVYPRGLRDLLIYAKENYNNPTIYVTENGIYELINNSTLPLEETLKDPMRIDYYHRHLPSSTKQLSE